MAVRGGACFLIWLYNPNYVQSISLLVLHIVLSKMVREYIMGLLSVVSHIQVSVTLTLTSDTDLKKMLGTYFLHFIICDCQSWCMDAY